MHRANVAIFLTAVGLMGIAPLLLGVAYVARKRHDRDPERRRTRSLVPIVVGTSVLLLVGAIGAWGLSGPGASSIPTEDPGAMAGPLARLADSTMPMELAGEPLTSYLDGPQAVAGVSQLHGESFAAKDAEIATYGDGSVTIWRSEAPDATRATAQVERMRARIAEGGSPFEIPHRVRGRSGVYVTFGMGQEHFFFARGTSVWWVAVTPSLAGRALPEALEASTCC